MISKHDLSLLNDPVAQELLRSTMPAHLAYNWTDGEPRVVPMWFHWTGTEFVLGTPPNAPKVKALVNHARVALSIDTPTYPHKVLQVRGTVRVETTDGVVPEYALAAERYFGEEQGRAWVAQADSLWPSMQRIVITPLWVNIIDFETRFPSAIASAMAG